MMICRPLDDILMKVCTISQQNPLKIVQDFIKVGSQSTSKSKRPLKSKQLKSKQPLMSGAALQLCTDFTKREVSFTETFRLDDDGLYKGAVS